MTTESNSDVLRTLGSFRAATLASGLAALPLLAAGEPPATDAPPSLALPTQSAESDATAPDPEARPSPPAAAAPGELRSVPKPRPSDRLLGLVGDSGDLGPSSNLRESGGPHTRSPQDLRQEWRDRHLDVLNGTAERMKRALGQLGQRIPPRFAPHVRGFGRWMTEREGRRMAAVTLALLALGWMLLRRSGRPGTVVVSIQYPAEVRGTFSVRLLDHAPEGPRDDAAAARSRVSTRNQQHQVAREARFARVRPGRYWAEIHGRLEDPTRRARVREITKAKRVTVKSRAQQLVEFRLQSRGCPLEVRVCWGSRPPDQASIAVRSRPDSIRYTRQGVATLELPLGHHVVLAGSGDRVAEYEIDLRSHEPHTLEVDLTGSERLVFKGCPPAVGPYLAGSWSDAAQALEDEGQVALAHELRARMYEEQGHPELAAPHHEEAERLRKQSGNDAVLAGDATPPRVATAYASTGSSRYDILEQIGRGGMGVVFKARDRRLGRLVALKQLPENLRDHPTAIDLFTREARAAAALNHPHIVTLYDADEEDGTYFITMELLEGLPLHHIIRKEQRLSTWRCCQLGTQIAAGLAYAHDKRIVHRDIKTANLFWTRAKTLKIMDFGLSKMMEEVRKATTVIGGTPYYVAPEQIRGESVDPRADLYALGVTLFEMATGQLPFTEGDVLLHHRETPPPDPRELAPELSPALADLILQLLAKHPDDRIQTAQETGQRLATCSAHANR